MIIPFLRRHKNLSSDLIRSQLFDERSFYPAFIGDLKRCVSEAIIECPFITGRRTATLVPVLKKLRGRGVRVIINTRNPKEHDQNVTYEADAALLVLQELGAEVLFTGRHHRKLAILDRRVLWEGSLNILSQNDSCEIMRRVESDLLALQMIEFARLDRFID